MNNKQSFWIIKDNKPQFIEGEIKVEEEGNWCEGEERFHSTDGHCYPHWFNTAEEAVRDGIERTETSVRVEKQLFDENNKYLKEEFKKIIKKLNKEKTELEKALEDLKK